MVIQRYIHNQKIIGEMLILTELDLVMMNEKELQKHYLWIIIDNIEWILEL